MTQISRVRGPRSRQKTRGEYTQEESTPGVPDFLLTALDAECPFTLLPGMPGTFDAVSAHFRVRAMRSVQAAQAERRKRAQQGCSLLRPLASMRGCAQRTRGL